MRTFSTVTLAAFLVATACAPKAETPAAAPAVDTAAALQGLDALRNQYIAMQTGGDAAGLAALHADSAGVDLYGLPRLRGKPAILAAITADLAARKYTLAEITPVTRMVRTNAEATELGTYHDMHDVKGTVDHEWGRYLGAFGKGADGQWKIQYLMAFPDSTKVDKK
jgi:ketosteroid isomerase-like protein